MMRECREKNVGNQCCAWSRSVKQEDSVYWKSMPRRKATRGNHNIKLEVIHMFDLNVNFLGL
jgi:hypothetical protein